MKYFLSIQKCVKVHNKKSWHVLKHKKYFWKFLKKNSLENPPYIQFVCRGKFVLRIQPNPPNKFSKKKTWKLRPRPRV